MASDSSLNNHDDKSFINFDEVLKRLMLATQAPNQTELARMFGLGPQAITSARARGRVPSKWIILAAVKYDISADWLLFGIGPMKLQQKPRSPSNGEADSSCPSLSSCVNVDLLTAIIEAVEEGLDELCIRLPPVKKAELISLLYDYFSKSDEDVQTEVIHRYLRLVK